VSQEAAEILNIQPPTHCSLPIVKVKTTKRK